MSGTSRHFEYPCVGALVTGRLHPDPADARSPLLRAFRLSGGGWPPRRTDGRERVGRDPPDMKTPVGEMPTGVSNVPGVARRPGDHTLKASGP